jgi:hypothetical protein
VRPRTSRRKPPEEITQPSEAERLAAEADEALLDQRAEDKAEAKLKAAANAKRIADRKAAVKAAPKANHEKAEKWVADWNASGLYDVNGNRIWIDQKPILDAVDGTSLVAVEAANADVADSYRAEIDTALGSKEASTKFWADVEKQADQDGNTSVSAVISTLIDHMAPQSKAVKTMTLDAFLEASPIGKKAYADKLKAAEKVGEERERERPGSTPRGTEAGPSTATTTAARLIDPHTSITELNEMLAKAGVR